MTANKPTCYFHARNIPKLVISCVAITVGFNSGCSTFDIHNRPVNEFVPTESDLPNYKVIFASPVGGEPTIYTGNITESMTIHDALVESGAVSKYKGMKIDLARRVPGQSDVLRLEIQYDAASRHVAEEWNYAIHPGDEILVRKEDVGALARAFKSLGG